MSFDPNKPSMADLRADEKFCQYFRVTVQSAASWKEVITLCDEFTGFADPARQAQRLADQLGLPYDHFGGPSEKAEDGPKEIKTITQDGMTLEIYGTRLHTEEEVLAHAGVDPDVYEVVELRITAHEMGFKRKVQTPGDDEENPGILSMFNVRAVLKKRKGIEQTKDLIEHLFTRAREQAVYMPSSLGIRPATGKMLEFLAPDLHVGKYAWHEENGANYDSNIAVRLFREAVDDLLAKAAAFDYDEIWFPIGNDLINSDNSNGTTFGGTPQSNDGRFERTIRLASDLMIETIEKFRRVARVKVIAVRGNHDKDTVFLLAHGISLFYGKCADVEVINSPAPRTYHSFGKVLIGYCHGYREKMAQMPIIMAAEARRLWTGARFCELHLGHLHKSMEDEFCGVKVRRFPSLCATDSWHGESGYVGSVRAAKALVWDAEDGEVACYTHNIRDGQ